MTIIKGNKNSSIRNKYKTNTIYLRFYLEASDIPVAEVFAQLLHLHIQHDDRDANDGYVVNDDDLDDDDANNDDDVNNGDTNDNDDVNNDDRSTFSSSSR